MTAIFGREPWTHAEDDFIINNPNLTGAELAKKLGRSVNASYIRRGFLGVSKSHFEHDDFIIKNYGKYSLKVLGEKLGVTRASIIYYVRRLKKEGKITREPYKWWENRK